MSNRALTDSPNSTLLALAWLLIAVGLSVVLVRNPIIGFAVGATFLFVLAASFSSRFSQAIVAILFLELVVGGTGHMVDFGKVISLRMAIFALLQLCFITAWLTGRIRKDFNWKKLRASWLGLLLGAGTFVFFGLFIGLFHGNPLRYVIPDSYGYLFLVAAIPIYCLSGRDRPSLKFVAFSFLSAVFVFGAIKAAMYIGVKVHLLSLAGIVRTIDDKTSQTVAVWGAYGEQRIAMVGDLFLAFGLPMFLAIANFVKTKSTKWIMYGAFVLVGIGLISSGTRGLWLGALCGIATVALLSGFRMGFKILLGLGIVTMLAISYFPAIAASSAQRFELSFNFSEPSNYVRVEQLGPLMHKAEQHLLLGNGYGATVPGLVRSEESPYSFELQTVALLMKMGIVGCGLWIWFLTWVMWDLRKTSRLTKSAFDRALAEGVIGGIVALLAASNTDPYFQAATGMGCLTFATVMTDILRGGLSLEPVKEKKISEADRRKLTPPAFGRRAPIKPPAEGNLQG